MGSGKTSSMAYSSFASSRGYDKKSTTVHEIYRSSSLDESLDPKKFDIRESVDGVDNPESTPIIVALDVTGSMAPVLREVATKGLQTICQEVYDRKPVTDPHMCVLGIGDVEWDRSPFQATQFEADIRIFEQLEKMYLEQGGGGNSYESYILAWYFAQFMTKTDSFKKRGRKGYIFTIGDEEITPQVTGSNLTKFLGVKQASDLTAGELYEMVTKEWNVFHITLKQGNHAAYSFEQVQESWQNVMGQNHIALDDFTVLGETVVSLIEIMSGRSVRDVTASWDGSKAVSIENAVTHLSAVPNETALDAVL